MIAWYWLIAAFYAGGMLGFMLAALLAANRDPPLPPDRCAPDEAVARAYKQERIA